MQHGGDLIHLLVGDLGDVNQTLDLVVDLNDGAEVQDLGDLALDDGPDGVAAIHDGPGVLGELLDAQGEALVVHIDGQDLGFHFVVLVVGVLGVLDLGGPGDVRHMHQAVDAILDAQEQPEGGDVADLGADDRANGVGLAEALPGVLFDLLHAQGDALVLDVDVQNDGVHIVAGADHLGGVLDALGPAHLGDMHQALDALFQLNERAVIGEVHDLAADALGHGILLGDMQPGILGDLLEAKGDALALGVKLEDLHAHFVAHIEHLGGVVDPAPGHVRDVQEAVDAPQVHEAAVLGDVLDDAIHHLALLEVLQGLALELLALFFKEGAAGQHDVPTLLVELDDLELEALPEVALKVTHGAEVNLGAGQEGLDADVDRQTTLDAAGDDAFHQFTTGAGGFDLVPDLQLLGLVLGELDGTFFVLQFVHIDIDGVAFFDGDGAVHFDELVSRDHALGLIADVHGHEILGDHHNPTLDNLARFDAVIGLSLVQQGFELVKVARPIHHVDFLVGHC